MTKDQQEPLTNGLDATWLLKTDSVITVTWVTPAGNPKRREGITPAHNIFEGWLNKAAYLAAGDDIVSP